MTRNKLEEIDKVVQDPIIKEAMDIINEICVDNHKIENSKKLAKLKKVLK